MKQRRKTTGATKTRYPAADRREPVDELVEQVEELETGMIQAFCVDSKDVQKAQAAGESYEDAVRRLAKPVVGSANRLERRKVCHE